MKTEHPKPIRLKDYRPTDYLVDRIDLDVSLDPRATTVRARLKLRRNPACDDGRAVPLQLDGEHLELIQLKLGGSVLSPSQYVLTDSALTIEQPPQRPFSLEISTRINPEENKALQGLYRSRGIYCTQCEAQGFRRITYFIDRPDVLAVYTVRLEADVDDAAVLLSNGNPVERGTLDRGKRHYAVWKDPHPKPCYLFALVGGNLSSIASTFRTMSGRPVDLRIYVEPGKESRAHWAMDALKRAMRWDERRFGREYDLDVFNIVAVSDFNLGAMENKGLNVFNDRLVLASQETATDAIYEAIESVVAHEYFHNWTGNRITCRDWFQLCLKEGLTVFRDQEFSADERSRTVQRIADVRQLRSFQFPEDQGPLAHPVRPESYIEINNFYTATVYEKGAELCRMIQTILGAEGFRKGMDLYFERHDGEAATVEQFVKCFEDSSGKSLSQFMLWYHQAGTPELVCSLDHDPARQTVALTVEQVLAPSPGQPKKKPFHIPLRMGLLGANGHDLPLVLTSGDEVADGVVHITRQKQTFRFTGVPSRPVPSLLRDFSAPVKLTIDLDDAELRFLMANDSDQFNRWQASNDYATRIMVAQARKGAPEPRSPRVTQFAQALEATLVQGDREPAYLAELLKLPSESDIARELGRNVDPALVHRVRQQVLAQIGNTIHETLERLWELMADAGDFSPDAASAGRRSLRNAALSLLAARGQAADLARVARHYGEARNMTEQSHALVLLASRPGPAGKAALENFFSRWKDDHVVIDTWFSAQAISPLASTVTRIRTLLRHPLFSLTAPNKVRALIGSFALHNPVQFNREDGKGYALVADQVLAIDVFNPQVAARLLGAFRSWRALEPQRRKLARKELQRIARSKGLSRDSDEIVSRMLEAPEKN